jgi:branched-chain amino acid transport system ATP-binding protein
MPLLQINHLSHFFGGLKAVDDFNLTLEEGELIGLIGPNGAGKTTVFNLVTGVYKATEGAIVYQGQDLVGVPPHKITGLGISRTFQTIRLWDQMSVLDNMRVAHHGQVDYGLGGALLRLPGYRRSESAITEHSMNLLNLFDFDRFAEIKEFDLTIWLIEHQMRLVMNICERLKVIDFGKTIAEGPPEMVRNDPSVLEAYLGEQAEVL